MKSKIYMYLYVLGLTPINRKVSHAKILNQSLGSLKTQ